MWRLRIAQGHDGANLLDHLGAGFAHIGQAVGLAGRDGQGDLVDAGVEGRLRATQIGHEHHHGQARQGEGVTHHLGGVGQLREQTSRHEGADFDFPQATGMQLGQPCLLVVQGHGGLDTLQPVSRADFADEDRVHGRVGNHPVSVVSPVFVHRLAPARPAPARPKGDSGGPVTQTPQWPHDGPMRGQWHPAR